MKIQPVDETDGRRTFVLVCDRHDDPVEALTAAAKRFDLRAASLSGIGAFSAVTSFTGIDSLVDAVVAALPPYRAKHVALNQQALRAGYDAAPDIRVPAWSASEAAVP